MSSGTALNKLADRKPLLFWLPFLLACILTLVMTLVISALQEGKQTDPVPSKAETYPAFTTTTTTTTTTVSTTWPTSRQSDLMVIWGKGYCLPDRWCPDNDGSARMISLDDDVVRPVRQPFPYQAERGVRFPQGNTNDRLWDEKMSGRNYACSVIWEGEFYVIGPEGESVMKMGDNCRMLNYGELSDDSVPEYSLNTNRDNFFSCFTSSSGNIVAPFAYNTTRGLQGRSPWVMDEFAGANSNYDHLYVYTAASNDLLLVVGGTSKRHENYLKNNGQTGSRWLSDDEGRNNKAETLDLSGTLDDTTAWTEVADFPYADWIHDAPMLYYSPTDEFLVIGGKGPTSFAGGNDESPISNRIAAFSPTDNAWSEKGTLLTKRRHAGVHAITDGFLVIGGFMNEPGTDRADMYRAEKCIYDSGSSEFTCNYVYDFGRSVPYGETYIVDATHVPACLP